MHVIPALTSVCVIAGAAALAGCGASKAAEPVAAAGSPTEIWVTQADLGRDHVVLGVVGDHAVEEALVTSGRVTWDDLHVAHVYSPVNGRVVRIAAKLGARVTKGAGLAVIESPYIGLVVSDLHKAEAAFTTARHDLVREESLDAFGATTRKAVEAATDTLGQAKAEVERAGKVADLLRVRGYDNVTQTFELTSPIDGNVIAWTVSPGVEVQGQYANGTPVELFTVADLARVWVISDVYQVDLGRVSVGTSVELSVLAYPGRVFKGTVEWVSGTLDPQSRTGKVRCSIDNADGALKPEMFATVKLSTATKPVVAVPRSAIMRMADYTFVFVETAKKDDGSVRLERVPVRLDDEGGDWVPVVDGVAAGATIVTEGTTALASKM